MTNEFLMFILRVKYSFTKKLEMIRGCLEDFAVRWCSCDVCGPLEVGFFHTLCRVSTLQSEVGLVHEQCVHSPPCL